MSNETPALIGAILDSQEAIKERVQTTLGIANIKYRRIQVVGSRVWIYFHGRKPAESAHRLYRKLFKVHLHERTCYEGVKKNGRYPTEWMIEIASKS